jgi:hypothetical protein
MLLSPGIFRRALIHQHPAMIAIGMLLVGGSFVSTRCVCLSACVSVSLICLFPDGIAESICN